MPKSLALPGERCYHILVSWGVDQLETYIFGGKFMGNEENTKVEEAQEEVQAEEVQEEKVEEAPVEEGEEEVPAEDGSEEAGEGEAEAPAEEAAEEGGDEGEAPAEE